DFYEVNAPVVLNVQGGTIDGSAMGEIDLTKGVSGTGGLNITAGYVSITGAGDYSGDTAISSNALLNLYVAGTMSSNVKNDGEMLLNGANTIYSGVLSGSGYFFANGDGTTLTGNNTSQSKLDVSSATVNIGNGGTSGSWAGDIVDDDFDFLGKVVFNR